MAVSPVGGMTGRAGVLMTATGAWLAPILFIAMMRYVYTEENSAVSSVWDRDSTGRTVKSVVPSMSILVRRYPVTGYDSSQASVSGPGAACHSSVTHTVSWRASGVLVSELKLPGSAGLSGTRTDAASDAGPAPPALSADTV